MEVIAQSASTSFTLEGTVVPEFVCPKRDHEFLPLCTPVLWKYLAPCKSKPLKNIFNGNCFFFFYKGCFSVSTLLKIYKLSLSLFKFFIGECNTAYKDLKDGFGSFNSLYLYFV